MLVLINSRLAVDFIMGPTEGATEHFQSLKGVSELDKVRPEFETLKLQNVPSGSSTFHPSTFTTFERKRREKWKKKNFPPWRNGLSFFILEFLPFLHKRTFLNIEASKSGVRRALCS